MLAGQPPYRKKTVESMVKAIRRDRLPDPRVYAEDVPMRVVEILHMAMAKKPDSRYQTVKEMMDDLIEVWNSLGAV